VKGFYIEELAFIFLTPVFIFYLFFVVPLKQKGGGRKAIMAFLGVCTICFQALSGPISHWIMLAGMALSLLRKKNKYPFVLAGAFIFSGIFLSIGASPSLIYRSLMIVGWIFEAYHLIFYACFFALVYHRVFREQASLSVDSTLPFSSYLEEKSGPAARVTGRLIKGITSCIVLFFIITGARLAYLNFLAPPPENIVPRLYESEQRMILQKVAQRIPDAFSEAERNGMADIIGREGILNQDGVAHRRLLIAAGKITPYVYPVAGMVDLDHMSRIFFPRPYDRTVLMVEEIGYCTLPNPVPEDLVGKDAIVVGRLDFKPEIIYEGRTVVEVIAILPWDPKERTFGPEPLIASEEVHKIILRLLRPTH